MSVQTWLAKNRSIAVVIALLVMLAAGMHLAMRLGGRRGGPAEVYLYDLQTGKHYPGDMKELPPVAAPSGGQAVRAYVFACGSCDNAADRQVGYLEKYTDEAKAEMAKEYPNHEILTVGQVVSLPGDKLEWAPLSSPRGATIRNTAMQRCENIVECRP